MRSYAGIKVASIYDPATGIVVQVNTLLPDSEFYKRPVKAPHPLGETVVGYDCFLRLSFFDQTSKAQLETWANARTPLRVVCVGVDKHIQWYESVPIAFTAETIFDAKTGINRSYIEMSFFGANPAVYSNVNLLAYLGWADTVVNNLADNYTLTGATAVSFTSLVQTIGNVIGTNGVYADVQFPVSGITLVPSFDVTALHSVDLNHRMQILNRNFAAGTISTTNVDSTSTGIKSGANATPAGIYTMRFFPIIGNGGSAGNVAGRNPALTVGRLTPGTSFMGY